MIENWGLVLVFVSAAVAVLLPGIGSAKAVGIVAQAGAGVLSETPEKFGKIIILEVLPGTQGLYGFLTAILLMNSSGVLGGEVIPMTTYTGLMYLGAVLPIAVVGYFSAAFQAKAAVGGVGIVAKVPDHSGKAVILAAMVETYAVLALLVSLLAIIRVTGLVA